MARSGGGGGGGLGEGGIPPNPGMLFHILYMYMYIQYISTQLLNMNKILNAARSALHVLHTPENKPPLLFDYPVLA